MNDSIKGFNLLIEFDLLMDKDIGIFKVLKDKYNNSEFLNITMMGLPDKAIIYEFINRKDKNPISLLLNKGFKDSADELLSEILEKEEETILKNSKGTSLLELMTVYLMTPNIKVDVLCKNKQEEQIINKINNRLRPIISTFKDVNISEYDSIFIKDIRESVQISNLKSKTIFIARYRFNMEEDKDVPLLKISGLLSAFNDIKFTDVYAEDKYITIKG